MRAYRPRRSTLELAQALGRVDRVDRVDIGAPSTYGGVRHPAYLVIWFDDGRRVEMSFVDARSFLRSMRWTGQMRQGE